MSKVEVDQVTQQSGTTLTVGGGACKTAVVDATTVTLGRCGGTVSLASGATQSGFGRTGTVDWQTTKKTLSFTAVNGEGYFVDTGGGIVTVTLPATPAAGSIVAVKDYDGNFGTNKCTIERNGSNIRGATNNFDLEKDNSGAVFIYVDATEGWQIFVDGSDSDAQLSFIAATGGCETNSPCGNYKIHTFNAPGTFIVNSVGDGVNGSKVDYMVVGGGGGGGVGNGGGGGGGAGGYRESKCAAVSGCWTASPLATPASLTITASPYTITVGGGGAAKPGSPSGSPSNAGNPGDDSTFASITSAGGGGGGGYGGGPTPCATQTGLPGGSGGGGAKRGPSPGGSGNTPATVPAQGTDGGNQTSPGPAGGNVGGGGGGAGGQGESVSWPANRGGNGGVGVQNTITGATVGRAGGGGSNAETGDKVGGTGGFFSGGGTPLPETPASGNSPLTPGFGGGNGSSGNECSQTGVGNGTDNTGGGAGGIDGPAPGINTGAGGSGIVVIRYRFQ